MEVGVALCLCTRGWSSEQPGTKLWPSGRREARELEDTMSVQSDLYLKSLSTHVYRHTGFFFLTTELKP